MGKLLKILLFLGKAQIGIGTTFWAHGDPQNPNNLMYCTNKVMNDDELVVAHPKLPCGSKAIVYCIRTKKSVLVTVLDRGPRRAAIDLSKSASKAIQLNGKEPVIILPIVSQSIQN